MVIGIRSDDRREPVIIKRIVETAHTSSGLVVVRYKDGTHKQYKNFIII